MTNTLIARLVFLCSFLLMCSINYGQDLHVYYDVESNTTRYEYNGKQIKKPKVKKGGTVFLHVENFNNYLYKLEVKTKEKEYTVATNGIESFSNVLNSASGGIGFGFAKNNNNSNSGSIGMGDVVDYYGFSSGIEDLLAELENEDFDSNSADSNSDSFGFAESSASQQEVSQLKAAFSAVAHQMVATEKELKEVADGVVDYKEGQAIKDLALIETEKLKFNPALKPSQIKSLSSEYLQKALEANAPEDISLSSLIVQSDGRKNLTNKLTKLSSNHRRYQNQVKDLKDISSKLQLFNSQGTGTETLFSKIIEVHQNAEKVEANVKKQREELVTLINSASNQDLEKQAALRYEFEAISSNEFKETFGAHADTDELKFDLKLQLKDSVTHTNAQSSLEMAAIQVPVFGGFKINASVGLSFGQFFNRPQDYFVRDSVILSDDLDSFHPIMTSFLHFYPQTPGLMGIGGTIGIGMPLTSNEGQQSLSFFAGPSIIFGNNERIVLTGGIMGGRVQRLAQGYEVGDIFISEADNVPVSFPYELGGFLGISFNLVR